MKKIGFFVFVIIIFILIFSGCTKEDVKKIKDDWNNQSNSERQLSIQTFILFIFVIVFVIFIQLVFLSFKLDKINDLLKDLKNTQKGK